jgi:hypothetical protein
MLGKLFEEGLVEMSEDGGDPKAFLASVTKAFRISGVEVDYTEGRQKMLLVYFCFGGKLNEVR